MRLSYFLLAAGAILLPAVARAQFSFAPGTYQLANGSKGEASLKLALAKGGSPTMMVGVKNGKERKFRTAEVTAITMESHRFMRVNDFRFFSGTDADFKEPALLEIIESGPIELFYHYCQVDMGTNFKAHVKLPVLRKASTSAFFAYSSDRMPGFDQKLAPGGFVAALFPADPMLQRQFAITGISRVQLAAAVHAYNQGVRLKP